MKTPSSDAHRAAALVAPAPIGAATTATLQKSLQCRRFRLADEVYV
jgi:hypothetical protein